MAEEQTGTIQKKKKVIIILGAVVILALIAAVIIYKQISNKQDMNVLELSGNVEVTEVRVGFKIPGRVLTLLTDEGRTVSPGEKIAVLDSAEYESLVAQNRAGVSNAEAYLEKAKKDFDRYGPLFQQGVITSQQMDAVKTAYDAALAQVRLSRASLKTGEVRLQDTVIYSSVSGVVLVKNVEEGETVAAGTPVFTIGDLENPWIKVYVKENKLGLVKLGQKAEVRTDSHPGKKYEGTVSYISSEAEFTPKNVQTQEERVKLVFGVKVKVMNENNELKPGMPTDVKILLK
jgi:HlyD family secretion protein